MNVKAAWGPRVWTWDQCLPFLFDNEIQQLGLEPSLREVRAHLRILARDLLGIAKPVFTQTSGQPVIEENVCISFAHKNNFYLIATSPQNKALGVDLEYAPDPIDWTPFQGRFFNAQDQIQALAMHRHTNRPMHECWLALFAMKESVIKASNRQLEPLDIELISAADTEGRYFEISHGRGTATFQKLGIGYLAAFAHLN